MSTNDPQDWLTKKRKEFGNFDLSSLNLAGWLLFMSSIALVVVAIIVLAMSLSEDGTNPAPGKVSRPMSKLVAGAVLLLTIGWFQLGKFVLGRLGISIYRAGRKK